MAEKTDLSAVNLPVVALVALVAIVGLVALVMNAASVKQFATGSKLVQAQTVQCSVSADCISGEICSEGICISQNAAGDMKKQLRNDLR